MKIVFFLALGVFMLANYASAEALVSAGKFRNVYSPTIGESEQWYINDHCFIHDGTTWHMFGITREEPARPDLEHHFAHATAKSLTQMPWEKQTFALSVDEKWGETHLWAPHVIRHDGLYYMFYCAGDKDDAKYRIHLAVSSDLRKWRRHPRNPMLQDGFHARDPMVLRVGDKWVMYYTATSEPTGGNHIVAYVTSDDLITWGNRGTAFVDPAVGTFGGPTESPFVVKRGDWYYLFIGPRGSYDGMDVFRSKDPFSWKIESKVGHIEAHAAEVIQDLDGKWYVSRCGWGRGGLYLAPLVWKD